MNGLPAASQSHTDGCSRMEESAPEKRRTYPFRFIHKWMLTIMILYLSYYFSDISVSHHLQTYTEKPSPKNISGNSELDVRNIDLPKAVRRKPKRRGRHLASLRNFLIVTFFAKWHTLCRPGSDHCSPPASGVLPPVDQH